MTDTLGAEPGERTDTRQGYRAGYYPRTLVTRVGKLEGAPLAYFGDPRLATKETGYLVYDVFSDIVVDEIRRLGRPAS